MNTIAGVEAADNLTGGAGVLAFTNNLLAHDSTNNTLIYGLYSDFSAGFVGFANSTNALTATGLNAPTMIIA